jgi:ubiquinone/menaquinone biosynthesis C-methylase UbiE
VSIVASSASLELSARPLAGQAFDGVAAEYDKIFTDSQIGRAQRDAVWRVLVRTFHPGDRVLELNCGTGEDALFLGRRGVSVLACDASAEMVAVARRRLLAEAPWAPIEFEQLPTERIVEIGTCGFEGVFSNFSGLNCVADLHAAAAALAGLVRPRGSLLLCLSSRYCIVEIVYLLCRGNPGKAFRRCRGHSVPHIGGLEVGVHYLSVRQLRAAFAPYFRLISYLGVGVAVPPSYCETWVRKHPIAFRFLCWLEQALASLPFLRVTGDHVLLHFRKEPT